VAVIGAGVMGAGIAASIAGAGIPVILLDIVLPGLSEEEQRKGITLDDPRHRNLLAEAGKKRVCDKKSGVLYLPEMADYITVGNLDTDLELLRDCDWVIEVVAEKLEIKHQLFNRIAPYLNAEAILSTNTSGIPVGAIAAGMDQGMRKRFLGTHFFNPPRYMRLLEIIPSEDTDPEILRFMKYFGDEILGKGIVEAKDTPNFIGNRIGTVSSPTILRLMEKYNFDVETVDYLTGPLIGLPKSAAFRTLDLVGLDILVNVVENLKTALKDPDETALFELPSYIDDMMNAGQLGNKAGGGFYKRSADANGKKAMLIWNAGLKEYQPAKNVKIAFVEEIKKQRRLKDRLSALLYSDEPAGKFLWEYLSSVLLYSAGKVPEITGSFEDIDKAMRWGYNWTVGPFGIWNLIGFEKAAEKMKQDGHTLPDWVEKRLAEGRPFYETDPDTATLSAKYPVLREMEHSTLLDLGDGVAGLEMHSPGSSITATLRYELIDVLNEIEAAKTYKGLVLLSSSHNFLNGADLKDIQRTLEAGACESIDESLLEFHELSLRLKYAKKPVVAAVHGMVLGGGMELSIHTARIVAHVDTYMGLVETGVGLIPGGGGIKELLMRVVADVSQYAYADLHPAVYKMWKSIISAEVSKNAFHARQMGYLRPTDKIVAQIDLLPQRAKDEILLMVKEGYRQALPARTKVPGTAGRAHLEQHVNTMRNGSFISEYDAEIAMEVAKAITGGDVPKHTMLSEAELLRCEREGFSRLCRNQKTSERIKSMMETGRALRN